MITTRSTLAGVAFAGALFLALAAAPAAAQNQGRIGLEVSAGYDLPGGDELDDLDPAIGFETIGSYALDGGLELGVGLGFASHDLDGGVASSGNIVNVFGEGRYRFGVPADRVPHLHPFLAARLGWTRLTLDIEDVGDDPSSSGLLFGGGGGVEYWFTDTVAAVGAGTIHFLNYGDSDGLPERNGHRIDLRGGLKVRF